MKMLSVDNGQIFDNGPEHIMDCIKKVGYNTIVERMNDDIREIVHDKNVNYSQVSFISAYLRKAKTNLIIG